MRIIPLINSDLVAVIDDREWYYIKEWKWYVADRNWITYAMGYHTGRLVLMHRLIMQPEEREIVDHINRDGLDNRRENLRIATASESSQNTKKRRDAIHSTYKGVSRNNSRWRARLGKKHIGYFDTEIEAALAYDTAAIKLFGQYAATNFKAESEVNG